MEISQHKYILEKVQKALHLPFDSSHLPIGGLRHHIGTHDHNEARWYAIPMDNKLSDHEWAEWVLPQLLVMGASGPSDRMRAQIKMVELMWDENESIEKLFLTSRATDAFIALDGLVKESVQRTQQCLKELGYQTLPLKRRGGWDELQAGKNEARSWTTKPNGADSGGYSGAVRFSAEVPVDHIAAFREATEGEVLVAWRSLAPRDPSDPMPPRLAVETFPENPPTFVPKEPPTFWGQAKSWSRKFLWGAKD